jgi:tRNA pseudouridine55 synthase
VPRDEGAGAPRAAGASKGDTVTAEHGLLVVDKPSGWTSHDVVGRARRLAGTRKVGHAGTLDPMATGVLVLGVGKATRLLGHLSLSDKAYDATIRLGATTVTDDAEGEVVQVRDASAVSDEAIGAAMSALTGDLAQVPSSVSAVKIDGVRSYARVRAGEQVELRARSVTVSRFALLARRGDELDVAVECTSGTYVRALARDLGAALGVGGHLTALRRTRVGPFTLDRARTLEQLAEDLQVLRLDEAVAASFPCRRLDADEAVALSYGKRVEPTGAEGTVGAFAPDGRCIALLEDAAGVARPTVVFAPAGG